MGPPGEPQGEDVARAQAALQQMTNGYWVTQIIYVAARLGIADLLKDGPRTISSWRGPPGLMRPRCTV